MATGAFTHNLLRTETTPIKTYRKVLKPSDLTYMMLSAEGQILKKCLSLYFLGCVKLAWYCGKMYSRHLFFLQEISIVCVARVHL